MKRPDQPFTYLRPDGAVLRGRLYTGDGALIAFLPGFRSVYSGEKARAVTGFAAERGHACLRFDYLGHGESDGEFEEFRVSEAMQDAAACITSVAEPGRPLYLVGSSMGAWIALELARSGTVAADGLLLIAPAVDFVTRCMALLPRESLEAFKERGFLELADAYAPGESYRLTQEFMMDAMLAQPPVSSLSVPCPVTIVHGAEDEAVPVSLARRLHGQIAGSRLVQIAGGDHRLTAHIPRLLEELDALMAEKKGPRP